MILCLNPVRNALLGLGFFDWCRLFVGPFLADSYVWYASPRLICNDSLLRPTMFEGTVDVMAAVWLLSRTVSDICSVAFFSVSIGSSRLSVVLAKPLKFNHIRLLIVISKDH